MAIETIGTLEAKTKLSALLARVQRGERFFITRHGRVIAELRPIAQQQPTRRAGFARGTFTHVAPDFDAPLADFDDYS